MSRCDTPLRHIEPVDWDGGQVMTDHETGDAAVALRFGTMTRIGRPLALAACMALAACARGPDSIEARYVSPNVYQTWTCEQLAEERLRLTGEVQRVSGLQRENAAADAVMMTVGIVVFWPILFGLAMTKDRKDELGRLKGEYDAVDLSMRSRQCTAPTPTAPSVPAVPPPQAATDMEGTWTGKGRTDSWCQPPTLALTVSGNRVAGELSELANGRTTSTVTGVVDPAGAVSLEFRSDSADHFSGKVDGALRGDVLSLAFQSTAPRACHYSFELARVR